MKVKDLKKELSNMPDNAEIEISIAFDSSGYPHLRAFSDEYFHFQEQSGDYKLLFSGSLNSDWQSYEDEPEQFGEEWEKEMMRHTKKELVALLKGQFKLKSL